MKLENRISFRDLGVEPTPGLLAALDGFIMGRNRADNEDMEKARDEAKRAAEARERAAYYNGRE